MSAAVELLREAQAAGIRLRLVGGTIKATLPDPPEAARPLIERLRQCKTDLLLLLAKPDGPCIAGHPPSYWQDSANAWHCMECEPNPAWHYLRGVTLAVLGNRSISLTAPAGDLPAPREWVRLPDGRTAEVALFEAAGTEVLVRLLHGERLIWFRPEQLLSELDWGWGA